MPFELCVLGSGSGGNATVVRRQSSGARLMLIDMGLGPRTVAKRLAGTGVAVEDIASACLTHLDRDHFNPSWLATVIRQKIRIFCHETCVEQVLACASCGAPHGVSRAALAPLVTGFATRDSFSPLPDLNLRPIHLAHDEEGSHGFVLETPHCRMGYATDLGCVPEELIELFCGVDVLALESNYDPEMEKNSDRPWYLKQRIMGGSGHLSNPEAFAAVRRILDLTESRHGRERLPRHIVLLHRSRQCNCPKLLRKLFAADRRIAPVLTLADQYEPTGWLRLRPRSAPATGEQMALTWG